MTNRTESTLVSRSQCPQCASLGHDNSGDNLAEYDDGHAYCFRCKYYRNGSGESTSDSPHDPEFSDGWTPYESNIRAIPERGLTEETCRRFSYGVSRSAKTGHTLHVENYRRGNMIVAQHLRDADVKDFAWVGSPKSVELFGQHLCRHGGKRLIITEGAIDAMSVSQVLGHKWPVVSITNGVASAVRDIKNNLEFVSSYESIILMFDNDEAGRKAANAVADVLPPGKTRIAQLPFKDANECLLNGNTQAIITAQWEAKLYSPDEILHVNDIISRQEEERRETKVYSFPFDSLSEFLIGQRSGEITMWCSGTGSGKTTLLKELMHHHLMEGRKVGAIMLEESPEETIDDMVSLMLSKPVRRIQATRMMNELRTKMGKSTIDVGIIDDLTDEEYFSAKHKLAGTQLFIYDHMGNSAMANLQARMEFMAVALEVDVIILDHITAAAIGIMGANQMDDDSGGGERLIIDGLMKFMRSLVSRTSVRIDVVSQLKKINKAFEEGDRITLQDLRGSGALSSVPNTVIAMERDRQSPDDLLRDTTVVRVLKNRLTGKCGVAAALHFGQSTGRLNDVGFTVDDEGNILIDPDYRASIIE